MSSSKFPNLCWALSQNPDLQRMVMNQFSKRERYLNYLDKLILDLKNGNCKNIQEKIAEGKGLLEFKSTLAELEIGRILLRNGKSITFLPYNYIQGASSPDILTVDFNGEAYVEVKLLTEDEIIDEVILEGLRQFLGQPNHNFCVNVKIGQNLSLPALKKGERLVKEQKAQATLDEFKKKFGHVNLSIIPQEIVTSEATFEIQPSGLSHGYPGIISTTVIEVPEEKLKEKFKSDVCDKAKKRNSWIGDDRKKLYIIAIYCEEWTIDEDMAEEVLKGIYPERNYIDADGNTRLTNMKNVSGVLVRFRDGGYYFSSNTLAADEINCSKLMNYI